jgi:5-methylcytosine-specific restriction endonuclease McrA
MSTFLIVALAVLAIIGVLVAKDETLKRERLTTEKGLLKNGFSEGWLDRPINGTVDSLGNVAYLVWLLHHEHSYRDYQGNSENQYPPDWEWRRRFVYLRDSNTCQGEGCGARAGRWMPLDCHHLKPISQFRLGEPSVHALTNLVTLCPICHASQHPENLDLEQRARRIWSQQFSYLPWDRRPRKAKPLPDLSSARPIRPVQGIGRHYSSQERTKEKHWPKLSTEEKERVLEGVKLAQGHQQRLAAQSAQAEDRELALDVDNNSDDLMMDEITEGEPVASFEELLRLDPNQVKSVRVRPQNPVVQAFNAALKEERGHNLAAEAISAMNNRDRWRKTN